VTGEEEVSNVSWVASFRAKEEVEEKKEKDSHQALGKLPPDGHKQGNTWDNDVIGGEAAARLVKNPCHRRSVYVNHWAQTCLERDAALEEKKSKKY